MSRNHFALIYNEIVVGCQRRSCLKLPTSLSVSLSSSSPCAQPHAYPVVPGYKELFHLNSGGHAKRHGIIAFSWLPDRRQLLVSYLACQFQTRQFKGGVEYEIIGVENTTRSADMEMARISLYGEKWIDFAERFGLPDTLENNPFKRVVTPVYRLPPSVHETMFEEAWRTQDV
jgi:hypothetical protein